MYENPGGMDPPAPRCRRPCPLLTLQNCQNSLIHATSRHLTNYRLILSETSKNLDVLKLSRKKKRIKHAVLLKLLRKSGLRDRINTFLEPKHSLYLVKF